MAKGNAPPRGGPAGLPRRVLLQVQQELHEGGDLRQPDAAHGKGLAMPDQKH